MLQPEEVLVAENMMRSHAFQPLRATVEIIQIHGALTQYARVVVSEKS